MDGIPQGGMDAGAVCPWMDGIPQGGMDADAVCPWMDGIPQGGMMPMRYVHGWTGR